MLPFCLFWLRPGQDAQLNASTRDAFRQFCQTQLRLNIIGRHELEMLLPALSAAQLPLWLPVEKDSNTDAVFLFQSEPDLDWSNLQTQLHSWSKAQQGNPSVTLLGEPWVNGQLEQSARNIRFRQSPIMAAVIFVLLAVLFPHPRYAFWHIAAIGGAQALFLGTAAHLGFVFDLLTSMVPALVLVLITAMQMHLSLAAAQGGWTATRQKIKPNLWVTTTSILGFISLVWSDARPVQAMGLFTALGLGLGFVWIHVLAWCSAPWIPRIRPKFRAPSLPVLRYPKTLLCLGVAILGLGTIFLIHQPLETNGIRYFPVHHPVRQSTEQFERRVGGTNRLTLSLDQPVAAKSLQQLCVDLRNSPVIEQASCPADWSPETLPLVAQMMIRPLLIRQFGDRQNTIQLWVHALDSDGYFDLERQILQHVAQHLPGIRAELHGPLRAISLTQAHLLGNLAESLITTILTICALVWLIFRHQSRAWVTLIVNLFPLAMMAIGMAMIAIPLSIASIMVFSIAFGVAIDDTIHLLSSFQNQTGPKAWQLVWAKDGTAVTATSCILGLGFFCLAWTEFLPVRHFAILLGIGIVCAWIGDAVLLPALLQNNPKERIEHDRIHQPSSL
ncbi:MAG: MMPL family transporter [Acidobacteria bacterium]|nr:MMPL family transporter [Acidobacteriota bacterium]